MDQSAKAADSLPPPEVFKVKTLQVACDGSGEVAPALGHPRVFLRIEPDLGFVECGYCDRRFVLEGDPRTRSHERLRSAPLPLQKPGP
ncbi:zinc-finger domain-containing protein [Sphingomonas daechungensis]|uniref:zinc-finger domain-containing protein n=1 Tax=Sphingomonas daechungensis TaxID=1176646 RepID=UPI001CB9180F|nr:zinc-finger domain-containing protein [Sphingomonas daechungensis]